jgi:hypothetical protein
MREDIMEAVFVTFILLFSILFIVNAPILETQKKYLWTLWACGFLLYPVLILRHIRG